MSEEERKKFDISFEQYRQALYEESLRLISTIRLYVHVNRKLSDRAEEFSIANTFFTYVLSSFFTTIVVWTDKLLNPRRNNERNYLNFLSMIENNRQYFSTENYRLRRNLPLEFWSVKQHVPITYEMIKEHRIRIENLNFMKFIALRRDKFHAHFDKEYFTQKEKLSDDAPIKWSDLDEVIKLIDEVFNRYSVAFDGGGWSFDVVNLYDIDGVVEILHKHNKQLKQEYGNSSDAP